MKRQYIYKNNNTACQMPKTSPKGNGKYNGYNGLGLVAVGD